MINPSEGLVLQKMCFVFFYPSMLIFQKPFSPTSIWHLSQLPGRSCEVRNGMSLAGCCPLSLGLKFIARVKRSLCMRYHRQPFSLGEYNVSPCTSEQKDYSDFLPIPFTTRADKVMCKITTQKFKVSPKWHCELMKLEGTLHTWKKIWNSFKFNRVGKIADACWFSLLMQVSCKCVFLTWRWIWMKQKKSFLK